MRVLCHNIDGYVFLRIIICLILNNFREWSCTERKREIIKIKLFTMLFEVAYIFHFYVKSNIKIIYNLIKYDIKFSFKKV